MDLMSKLFGAKKRTERRDIQKVVTGRTFPSEIDERVAGKTGLDSTEVRRIRLHIFREIARDLDRGEVVNIRGLFTLYLVRVGAHTKRLPDDTTREIPTRDHPRIRWSRAFRKWIQRPGPEDEPLY